MASFLGFGEEQSKSRRRSIFFAAMVFLVLIWTIKLSFPQHKVLSNYTNHPSQSLPGTPTSTFATKGKATPQQLSGPSFSAESSTKAAVLIDTRFRVNLIPLILHFSSVLGPTWPIFIYTNMESVSMFSGSAALSRSVRSGQIQIRTLPQEVLFTNSQSVNAFMTKRWLWESLAPAENILIFQSDSMLCANAVRSVDDFFHYDFIGAPIAPKLGIGYNGGLSLRKRSSTLRILDRWDWEKTMNEKDRFEDQWYYKRLVVLQNEEKANGTPTNAEGSINLPSMEIARTFAVETIDYPHPLGVHQVHRWLKAEEHILSLDEWCPEYKMCSNNYIVDTQVSPQ